MWSGVQWGLFSLAEEGNPSPSYSLDAPGGHHVQGRHTEGQTLCGATSARPPGRSAAEAVSRGWAPGRRGQGGCALGRRKTRMVPNSVSEAANSINFMLYVFCHNL